MDIKHTNSNSINFRPSFNSVVKFSANINSFKFGNNYSQRIPKGINSLVMNADLIFDLLTDDESQSLISFLQKQFYHEPQNYSNLGYFTNKRILPFSYQVFYPYKINKFNCLRFNHERGSYNVNNITASLESIASSILDTSETGPGINTVIDGLARNRFSEDVHVFDILVQNNASFKSGNILYRKNSYLSATMDQDINIDKDTTSRVQITPNNSGWTSTHNFNFKQTDVTHSIFIDNPNECSFYPYPHITSDGEFPCRVFNFRPTQSFSLEHSPKFKQSSVESVYKKYNKYGINPNLSNLSLNFSGLSNLEAKSILLFLESHLGYKKFGYHFHYKYNGNDSSSIQTTPNQNSFSTFYCPEWTHRFVYHDNHEINATFMECPI